MILRVAPSSRAVDDPGRFIRALATAPTSRARRNVLRHALDTLETRDGSKELPCLAPGIPVVVQCLARAASRPALWNEVEGLCRLLSLMLRGAASQAVPVLECMFTVLVSALLHCLNSVGMASLDKERSQIAGPAMVGSLYQLLEEVSYFRISLHQMKDAPLLLQLVQQVIRDDGTCFVPSVQVEAVRVLTGLASNPDNTRALFHSYPSLIRTVLTVPLPMGSELHVATLLRHLALDPVNRVEMIGTGQLVATLLTLGTQTHVGTLAEVMRTFDLLLSSARARWVLVQQRKFLKVLTLALKEPALQGSSLHTLLNLTGPQTAKKIFNYSGLLEAIVGACTNEDAAPIVGQTIKELATHMGACERRHPLLIAAMVKLSMVHDPKVRLWVSKAFLEQSKIASSSFFVVRTPKVIAVVLSLCRDENATVQATATEALMRLASTKANHQQLISHPSALRTMVENTLSIKQECECKVKTCQFAGRAIMHLITSKWGDKTRFANEIDILVCLAHLAVSKCLETELKGEALKALISLSPLVV